MLYNIENQHEIMRVPSKTSSFGFILVYYDTEYNLLPPGFCNGNCLTVDKKKLLYNIAIDYSNTYTKPLEMLIISSQI